MNYGADGYGSTAMYLEQASVPIWAAPVHAEIPNVLRNCNKSVLVNKSIRSIVSPRRPRGRQKDLRITSGRRLPRLGQIYVRCMANEGYLNVYLFSTLDLEAARVTLCAGRASELPTAQS